MSSRLVYSFLTIFLRARRQELDASDALRAEDAKTELKQRSKAGVGQRTKKAVPAKKAAPKKKIAQEVDDVVAGLDKVVIEDGKVEDPPKAAAGRKRVSKKTTAIINDENFVDAFSPVRASPAVKRSKAAAESKAAKAPPAKPPASKKTTALKPSAPTTKKAAQMVKKAIPAKKAPRKVVESESESEAEEDDEDSDVEFVSVVKNTPRPTRAARARKQVLYVDDDLSDEDGQAVVVDDDEYDDDDF